MKSFLLALLSVALLGGWSLVAVEIYRDQRFTRVVELPAADEDEFAFLHSGEYYKEKANRLQYVPHDPQLVQRLYSLAIARAPVSYEVFFAYVKYLWEKNCCDEDLRGAAREMVKRNPTDSLSFVVAGRVMLQTKYKQDALHYFRKALEMGTGEASQIYQWLDSAGFSKEDLL